MNTAILSGLGKYRDFGLLLLRAGIGAAFIVYGYPKISGGPEFWKQIGGAMGVFGVDFYPVAWGFMAALAEFGGGILLILGLFSRVANLLMLATMAVAIATLLDKGEPFTAVLHPIEMAIVFLSLLFLGPGRHSIDGR
jgi:putative oxidoreductase